MTAATREQIEKDLRSALYRLQRSAVLFDREVKTHAAWIAWGMPNVANEDDLMGFAIEAARGLAVIDPQEIFPEANL